MWIRIRKKNISLQGHDNNCEVAHYPEQEKLPMMFSYITKSLFGKKKVSDLCQREPNMDNSAINNFPIHFITLDPVPQSECGSGSTGPNECGSDQSLQFIDSSISIILTFMSKKSIRLIFKILQDPDPGCFLRIRSGVFRIGFLSDPIFSQRSDPDTGKFHPDPCNFNYIDFYQVRVNFMRSHPVFLDPVPIFSRGSEPGELHPDPEPCFG